MSKGTILVTDDEEIAQQFLSHIIRREGYEVEIAENGARALELIKEHKFSLILLDIEMPDMDGIEVLKIIRKTHSKSELPVIMATAMDSSDDMVKALDAGANDYMTKPLDIAVLLARIRAQLSDPNPEKNS